MAWNSIGNIKGPTGSAGSVGPQGPAGFSTVTPNSSPGRSLNTVFQPSTTNAVAVFYDVDVTAGLSLSGGTTGRVQLLSDASNPPTTIRRNMGNGNSGALTIGLSLNQLVTMGLSYIVPIGHFVKLVTVNTTGTPTFSLAAQTEEVLG